MTAPVRAIAYCSKRKLFVRESSPCKVCMQHFKLENKNNSNYQAEERCSWQIDELLQTKGRLFIHFRFEL